MENKEEVSWTCDECGNDLIRTCEECNKKINLKLGKRIFCINGEAEDHFCSVRCAKRHLNRYIQETTIR